MTGRGIDQIMPHPLYPQIFESYMKSAKGYVDLAENVNGPIPYPVDYDYIWGEALSFLEEKKPVARIINLETSITTSNAWENKGINYRMHPKNAPCLTAAKINCCSLANNHTLDWGEKGLVETLETLKKIGISAAGAGFTIDEATAPAIFNLKKGKEEGRILIFAFGTPTSGVPPHWQAKTNRPGVNYIASLNQGAIDDIRQRISQYKKPKDIVIVSIHWGGNWGYEIPKEHRQFAHDLIDLAAVDIVHGHSSHHFKGIEVYQQKLILYGCGDFINDYEGISGYEEFRSDLALMYFPTVDMGNGKLLSLEIVPLQMKQFQLQELNDEDRSLCLEVLNREGANLYTKFKAEGKEIILCQ